MPGNYHGRGSIGTSMGLIRVVNGREIKKKPPKRCDCKKCAHAIIHGDCVDCYITGEVAVNKQYCYHFKSTEPEKQYSKPKKPKKRYGGKSRSKSKTKVKAKKKKEV